MFFGFVRVAVVSAFVVGALTAGQVSASAGTLEDVKARGVVRCGVAPNSPGFAYKDAQGNYRGFDIDFCHAIAAAVFGDGKKVEISPLGLRDGFATLASGGVDVLTHRFTWTFNRDNGTGIETVTTVFYDGQGFIARKSANLKSVKDLNGATICVAQGSTSELNLADYFRARGMKYQLATFADLDEARNAYEAGRCDAWTNDRSNLAARAQGLKNRAEHMLLADTISKEPIGPMVKAGDSAWFHVVRWTVAAIVGTEELGVTSQNVDQLKQASDTKPEAKRLLGIGDNLGQKLGLSAEWAYNVVKQVGNYGEIFERHVGEKTPLGLSRGQNAQWIDGGLLQAPPFR